VDAGHGYCVIRRRNGALARLAERSLPVGVSVDDAFSEGVAHLDPGDALIVYSDGLVERADRTLSFEETTECLTRSDGAEATLERLLANRPSRVADDVTVLVRDLMPDGQAVDRASRTPPQDSVAQESPPVISLPQINCLDDGLGLVADERPGRFRLVRG
jgi:hypothetical protein